jgi:hypothetical protein
MTILSAAYDILNRLGITSDDSPIDIREAMQWLDNARLALIKDMVEDGQDMPPSMFVSFDNIASTPSSGIADAMFDLPVNIVELNDDEGIAFVLMGKEKVDRMEGGVAGYPIVQNTTFGKCNIQWYREGSTVKVVGKVPFKSKFSVVLMPSSIEDMDEEGPFPAPSNLWEEIAERAEKIGLRELGRPVDLINDGKQAENGER